MFYTCAMTTSNHSAPQRLLSATETLIYTHGIHATGLDAIVKASGVARKTIYSYFSSKEALVAEVLRQRDQRWMAWFIAASSRESEARARLLSTFDALEAWFNTADFNGCAFINAAGEVGKTSPLIAEVTLAHKQNLKHYLQQLAIDYGAKDPVKMATDFLLLIDGAITLANVMADKQAANKARQMALHLLDSQYYTQANQAR